MNCSADAKTIYAIYSNNYQSSSQEPRRVHSPLPRTTLRTDHCTMELQVFVQFHPIFSGLSLCLDIFNMSIPSGHQKPFPYVPSLVHVPIPVCHLYMIRLWISCTLKMLPTLIVKETATRRATQSSHLPTLRLPSRASTIQMLPTNSTTGTRGTIDMSIFNKISGIYISALFTYL